MTMEFVFGLDNRRAPNCNHKLYKKNTHMRKTQVLYILAAIQRAFIKKQRKYLGLASTAFRAAFLRRSDTVATLLASVELLLEVP
jgi:hypothetical protein